MTSNLGHLWSTANWLRHHISGQAVPDRGITAEEEAVYFSHRVPMEAVYLVGPCWSLSGQMRSPLRPQTKSEAEAQGKQIIPLSFQPTHCKGAGEDGRSFSGLRPFSVSQSGYPLESYEKLQKCHFLGPFPADYVSFGLWRGPRHHIIGKFLKCFSWEPRSYSKWKEGKFTLQ